MGESQGHLLYFQQERFKNENSGKKLGNKMQNKMKFLGQNTLGFRHLGSQNPCTGVNGLAGVKVPVHIGRPGAEPVQIVTESPRQRRKRGGKKSSECERQWHGKQNL